MLENQSDSEGQQNQLKRTRYRDNVQIRREGRKEIFQEKRTSFAFDSFHQYEVPHESLQKVDRRNENYESLINMSSLKYRAALDNYSEKHKKKQEMFQRQELQLIQQEIIDVDAPKKAKRLSQMCTWKEKMLTNTWQEPYEMELEIVDIKKRQDLLGIMQRSYSIDDLQPAIEKVAQMTEIDELYEGIIVIRKILAKRRDNETIQLIIDSNILYILLDFLQQVQFPQLKLESIWIISNILSGQHHQCECLVNKGIIAKTITLLREDQKSIVERAIQSIGNIAADCSEFRSLIIEQDGLRELVLIAENTTFKNIFNDCIWAINNILTSPLPEFVDVKEAIQLICLAIKSHFLRYEDVCDAVRTVSRFSIKKYWKQRKFILQSGVLPVIMANAIEEANKQYSGQILRHYIRIIQFLSEGSQLESQILLQQGLLQLLHNLLLRESSRQQQSACFILSNITAGSKQQVQSVITHPQILVICRTLLDCSVAQVKYQICYMFGNMAFMGNVTRVFTLYKELQLINGLAQFLVSQTESDARIIMGILKTFDVVFKIGQCHQFKVEGRNVMVGDFLAIPFALERLQNLQFHEDTQVYSSTEHILRTYFQEYIQ